MYSCYRYRDQIADWMAMQLCVAEGLDGLYDPASPGHRWERPLQAPGRMQGDFEERVDFRRLHEYRLARTRNALAKSGLGALLVFDQINMRYISSTVIGEWGARQVDALVPAERQRRALEEVVLTPGGARIITLFPAQELPIANKY